jgi:cytochrome c biogenesis protein CcmG/thiol:disulfide interchange protein DsbE
MKRNSLVLGAVLAILAFFGWAGWANFEFRRQAAERLLATAPGGEAEAGAASDGPPFIPMLLGKPAPAFTLEDLSGRQVSLASYKGKALLINFWATWCGPCKIETPWLIELRNRYAGQGFEVLGVSMDDLNRGNPSALREEKQEIARFVGQTQIPYPVLIGGDAISRPYGGLDELPASVFVNRDGTVVAAQLGATSKSEIDGDIRKALGAGN